MQNVEDEKRLNTDEYRLIERAQCGEHEAMVEIYECCQPSVFTYVYYRVGNQEIAEDLTAEVFTRMVGKLRQFTPGEAPILAWLYTIARHLVADHYRSRPAAGELPLEDDLAADETSYTARAAERRLTQQCLQKALSLLTEEQRLVILLKFVEDRSNLEVAEIMGKNEGSVKSLQHRALGALHRILEQERCDEPDL